MEKKKRTRKPKGLGDTVEGIFKATGIDKVAKFILGEDCGCDERKAKLNELFPYKQPKCLEEAEYNYLHVFFERYKSDIRPSEQRELLLIYNRVLNQRQEATSCSSCWRAIVADLKRLYNEY